MVFFSIMNCREQSSTTINLNDFFFLNKFIHQLNLMLVLVRKKKLFLFFIALSYNQDCQGFYRSAISLKLANNSDDSVGFPSTHMDYIFVENSARHLR